MMNLTLKKTKWNGDPAADRDKFIGGSDIGTILGMNPWKSAYTLWAEKSGLIEAPDISDKEAVWWGNYDEEGVAKRFCEKTGKKVRRSLMSYYTEEYPFIAGHVDRLVVGEEAGLECKTTSSFNKTDFESGEVPPMHWAQCQLYMFVTGYQYWYYAVKRDNREFYYCRVDRAEAWIEGTMLPAAIDFWRHIQNNEPVEVDGSDSTADTLTQLYPGDTSQKAQNTVLMLPKEMADKLSMADEIAATAKKLKEQADEIKNSVKAEMKDHQKATAGIYSVTWARGQRTDLDKERLKKERPDIYEHYSITKPYERFSYRKMKEAKK